MEQEKKERHLHLVDASILEPSLSPESVSQGELEAMLIMAQSILDRTGEKSNVNGIPAHVSKAFAEVSIGERTYYGRVFQIIPPKGAQPDLPTVGFDETPDLQIVSRNFRAIRFEEIGRHIALITDTDDAIDPEVNNIDKVRLVGHILETISVSAEEEYEKKLETERQERAAHEQAEKAAKEAKRNARHYNYERAKEVAGTIGEWVLGGAVAVAAVGAAVFGLSRVDWSPKGFDDKTPRLTDGTELVLGSDGPPEFSKKLYSDPVYSKDKVPELGDAPLAVNNVVREVFIRSSGEGHNCVTGKVDRVPLDMRLVAWTDFTSPDGNSRANELDVKYETEKFTVCWHGQELNADDDPRIVVTLRPANESKPR